VLCLDPNFYGRGIDPVDRRKFDIGRPHPGLEPVDHAVRDLFAGLRAQFRFHVLRSRNVDLHLEDAFGTCEGRPRRRHEEDSGDEDSCALDHRLDSTVRGLL